MRRLRWIVGLSSVLVALTVATPLSAAPAPPARPVFFIHGWNLNADTGCSMWKTMIDRFREWGKGKTIGAPQTVAFYHGDKGCNTPIDGHGDHSKSPGPQQSLPGPQPHREGSHTTNTPIEHLAYHLAWTIYDLYSSHGQPVDVVAHSMGGLMIRYALAATERNVKDFPPYLLVEDVVTLGTPHGGARGPVPSVQGAEMQPGSPFLKALGSVDLPQGRGGSDWLTVGSDDDTAVAADRAAGTDRDRDPRSKYIASQHKVWYTAVNHLEHGAYYKVDTKNVTAVAFTSIGGRPFLSHPVTTVYPMRLTYFSLLSSKT
jgi:pimeloyl-ACP methyl ester carboxylesterase